MRGRDDYIWDKTQMITLFYTMMNDKLYQNVIKLQIQVILSIRYKVYIIPRVIDTNFISFKQLHDMLGHPNETLTQKMAK